MPKSVWLLVIIASLVMPSAPLLVLAGAILGHQLSPSDALKTLPIALFVIGAATTVYPAVRLMGHYGRKKILLLACSLMFVGALLAALAAVKAQFWWLCGAGFLLGGAQSVFAQIRFAAMEQVDENKAPTAASKIMLSGLVAAILGPELIRLGHAVYAQEFVGGFLLLAVLAVLAAVLLQLGYSNHRPPSPAHKDFRFTPGYPNNPVFWLAILAAAVAYGFMSLIMTATPLTMHVHQNFELVRTKEVIQGHIVAMFLPSFFSGWLITRFGAFNIILLGLGCYLLSITAALSGLTLPHFWVALLLLGMGWNFMFVAATTLLPLNSRGFDPFRMQALNDFIVVLLQATAALCAGWWLDLWGWRTLVAVCAPLLVLCLFLILWAKLRDNNP